VTVETIRKWKTDLEAWFSRLAPRERVLVSAGALAVACFVLFLVFTQLQRGIAAREAAVDRKTEVIARVGKLAEGYREAEAQRAQLEAKLKGPPLQLMSFVAQTGQRLGIEVNDLRPGTPGSASASDKVVEDTVEVNLAKLELPKLASLLQELERGPGVVKVRRLALRTRNDDPNAVDATIVIATYQLKS
jgi:general secretion pathway protein M